MANFSANMANGYSAKLTLTEGNVDIVNNTSKVYWAGYLISTYAYFQDYEVRRKLYIDGGLVANEATQMSINQNSSITVFTGSKIIAHNADGKKTINFSFLCETTATSYTPGSKTITGSFKLADIPRKSSFGGLTQRNIGTPMTLSINRASSSFTHKVWYHMPGQSWVLIGSGYGTTCNFTIPLSSCSYLPNSTSGRCDFCIETFNGSTSLGSTYEWYTVSVPSSVVPIINNVTLSERNTAVSSVIDKWVQSVSMIRIAAATSMAYGATISSIDIFFQGKHYPQWTVDTDITQSGTLPITVTVKDSRGRTAVHTMNITVLAYMNPQITNLSIIRANAQGDSDVLGTTAKVSFNSAITSITSNGVEKNIRRVKIERLNNSPKVLFDAVVPELGGALSKLYMPYDIALSYEFKVTVSDIFGRANEINIILPKGIVTMHMGDDSIGVGTLLSGDTHNIEAGSKGILTNGKLTQRQGTDEVEFSLSQAFIDKWKNLLSGGGGDT